MKAVRLAFALAALTALSWMIAPSASAVPVDELYDARVPVADQSDAERERALREALAQVIRRVTGDRTVHAWADTTPLLNRAGQLVLRYGYESVPDADGNEPALILTARFDGRSLERALLEAGLPVWGSDRPMHLLWIALAGPAGGELLGQEDAADQLAPLLAAARDRGLPVMLPLLDLEDRAQLRPEDLRDARTDRILTASARYGAGQIVTAWLERAGGIWAGYWTLLDATGPVDAWTVRDTDLARVLDEGLQMLADRQAARLAVRGLTAAQIVPMRVDGVTGLDDYARVMAHLSSLNAAQAVDLIEAEGDSLLLRLRVRGTADVLIHELAARGVLRPRHEPAGNPADHSSTLEYVLVR